MLSNLVDYPTDYIHTYMSGKDGLTYCLILQMTIIRLRVKCGDILTGCCSRNNGLNMLCNITVYDRDWC